jgi:dCMP deaminase
MNLQYFDFKYGIRPHEAKWLVSCDHLAKTFSTCAKRQYFAVIIGDNKRLLSQGYNGSPPGMGHCNEGYCPRYQNGSPSGSIYDDCIATHAEANAIMWADPHARKEATLIINGSPCYGCAKLIVNSGIRRIIGQSDETYTQEQHVYNYLLQNRIDTILLKNNETRKIRQIIDQYVSSIL